MENHQQIHQNLPSMLDALYCEEVEESFIDENEENESFINGGGFGNTYSKPPPLMMMMKKPDFSFDDEEELKSLLSKENENGFFNVLEKNPGLIEARHEAIEWMMKVVAYYSFSALTAVYGVNYLDRFLFSFLQSHGESEKPWMIQLAAVACLSLAAKVEETHVPLLLDLQVEQTKYVFEAKTIQRMEILVLSTLQWKMNPVTPISFLDYITRKLGLNNNFSWKFFKRCEFLLLAIISDCKFMCYLPSVMATATMLHVINNIEPCTLVDFQDQLLSILGINKEKVEDCRKVIQEMASQINLFSFNKRKYASLPGSPKGVMEVSFSCSDSSSNDSWSVTSSVTSSPEPSLKKCRVDDPYFQGHVLK